MTQITEEYKKELWKDLADAMIAGMEKGDLDDANSRDSARFAVGKMDNIKNTEEVKPFLEELAKKWPSYQIVLTKLKAEEVQIQDKSKINEIQSKLNQLIVH